MAPGAIWPMSWEVLFGRARRLLARGGSARTRAVVVLRRREGGDVCAGGAVGEVDGVAESLEGVGDVGVEVVDDDAV